MVNNIFKREIQHREIQQQNDEQQQPINSDATLEPTKEIVELKTPILKLPYAGNHGEDIVKRLRTCLKAALPESVQPRLVYTSRKLSSFFSLKDKTEKEHKHDVVYNFNCGECNQQYIGETGRRFGRRVHEHIATDKKSHVYKHVKNTGHHIDKKNFSIIGANYGHFQKRRILEALYIHQKKPSLNVKSESVPLKLFS